MKKPREKARPEPARESAAGPFPEEGPKPAPCGMGTRTVWNQQYGQVSDTYGRRTPGSYRGVYL